MLGGYFWRLQQTPFLCINRWTDKGANEAFSEGLDSVEEVVVLYHGLSGVYRVIRNDCIGVEGLRGTFGDCCEAP